MSNQIDAKIRSDEAAANVVYLEKQLLLARQHKKKVDEEFEQKLRVSAANSNEHITVEALRERIADFARAHETGKDDVYWKLFREALAELARRAGGK